MKDKVRERVRVLMSNKHITGKYLASQLGITPIAICKLLNGQNAISIERATQIAAVLGVELWELFYTKEELFSSINSTSAGNGVTCPYCGKELVLSIK